MLQSKTHTTDVNPNYTLYTSWYTVQFKTVNKIELNNNNDTKCFRFRSVTGKLSM